MKLSIITCTYNSEKYLQECIDSVIAQNLNVTDYEHIFVDAYSNDKTKEIINKYMKKYSNVKLIEREPKGVYNAMNEGIYLAKGEYILCLNSDDFLEPNILNNYLKFIQKTKTKDMYYGEINFFNNGVMENTINSIIKKQILFRIAGMNVLIFHPSVLIKKSVLLELGMFDESKKIASDYGMWLNMMKNGKKYIYYPNIVTTFRVHDGSISSNKKNQAINDAECKYFQKKYLPRYKKILLKLILFAGKIKRQIESIIKN